MPDDSHDKAHANPLQGMAQGEKAGGKAPYTLAIDIGGTGLKASVLDSDGQMVVPRVWVKTPYPCPPDIMLEALEKLVQPLPAYQRISIGFPGMVRDGKVLTAPHFDTGTWKHFPLAEKLGSALHAPARLANDADIQGLGVIQGHGLEMVLTLGTGAGTALFINGRLTPHLELAHHPVHRKKTYNDYVGHVALEKSGKKRWNRHVQKVIDILYELVCYDTLYIGGGNAKEVTLDLPGNVHIVSNDAGITGGIALWRNEHSGV
ncbi:ROK family protein [Granulibacter bethesdensis]|uniref:ROK family protein n=1 Tax=Granulibacter bethesdensis TaxID=364410 RepID=UPI0003F20AB3|nr:ROK family protein [Granulibacter bethesdensis]AHJ64943.1 Polyphosphate glucokinase [Granulibacter bethesdensis CGDNIH4]